MGARRRSALSVVGHVDVVAVSINHGAVRAGDGSGGTGAPISDDGGSTATILHELFVTGPPNTQSTVWKPIATDPNWPLPDGNDPTTPHQCHLLLTIGVDDLESDKSVVVPTDVRIVSQWGCPPTPVAAGSAASCGGSWASRSATADTPKDREKAGRSSSSPATRRARRDAFASPQAIAAGTASAEPIAAVGGGMHETAQLAIRVLTINRQHAALASTKPNTGRQEEHPYRCAIAPVRE